MGGHTLVCISIAFQHRCLLSIQLQPHLGPSTKLDSLGEVIRNGEKKGAKRSPRSEWRRRNPDIVPGMGEVGQYL